VCVDLGASFFGHQRNSLHYKRNQMPSAPRKRCETANRPLICHKRCRVCFAAHPMRRELASSTAHKFQTPLSATSETSVKGFASCNTRQAGPSACIRTIIESGIIQMT
jgi:hypothetical protein